MRFQTLAAAILPLSGALANPATKVSARQPALRASFVTTPGAFQASGPGCNGASVVYSSNNELADVSLPNYSVSLPTPRESRCQISLLVHFPVGLCTTGTALGHASGRVTIMNTAPNVVAQFHGREYAVSPSPKSLVQVSPDGQWSGPTDRVYSLEDRLDYTVDRPDANNANLNFTLQGGLQLQPANGANGFLSNSRFVFDISRQGAC